MRRYDDHFETVNLLEFEGLGISRTRHARQVVVQAKEVLKCNRRDGLILLPDRHALLGLNCLVQTIGPTPSGHRAPCEFVHNHNFAVFDYVFDVAMVNRMRPECRVKVM